MGKLDCRKADWKPRLKLFLQDEDAVDLVHFDYTVDGQFCETPALPHAYHFKLDARNGTGFFTKRKLNQALQKKPHQFPDAALGDEDITTVARRSFRCNEAGKNCAATPRYDDALSIRRQMAAQIFTAPSS